MSEMHLRRYSEHTRSSVPVDFTAKVMTACGLDRYVRTVSPLGDVFVAWNSAGVSALRRAEGEDEFETWFDARFGRRAVPAMEEDSVSRAARAQLRGEEIAVPVDLSSCSEFERRVLERAAEIPSGHARPYSLIARELGQPNAPRAVGNALAHNPVPLLIPCHRVIRGDYTCGGYVFGGDLKRALLEREGINLDAVQDLVHRGIHYVGNDDGSFCLPTCGNIAERFDEGGHFALHTLDECRAHGLEPCSECRPIPTAA